MRQAHKKIVGLVEPFQPSFTEGYDSAPVRDALLVKIRWVFILGQLALLYPAILTEYLPKSLMFGYLSVTLALSVFNLFAPRLRGEGGRYIQLSIDLTSLSLLLLLTAGCHNPFSSLLFVSSVLGPMFLNTRWAIAFLVQTGIAFCLVCAQSEPEMLNASGHHVSPILTVAIKVMTLLLMGGLALWLKAGFEEAQDRYLTLHRQRQRLNNFRALGIVASQLSHEMSTPLNTIKLMLSRMQRKQPDLAGGKELIFAQAALAQCEQSIRQLFDTRVSAETLDYRETHVADFVRCLCENWGLDFPDAALTIEADAAAEDLQIRLPTTPFAQSLLDLLDNACEASTTAPDILVRMQTKDGSLELSIADRGSGVPEAVAARLGEPFNSSKSTGTGLGLYNAQSLMEALGGRLGIAPRDGGGTRVSLVLPL